MTDQLPIAELRRLLAERAECLRLIAGQHADSLGDHILTVRAREAAAKIADHATALLDLADECARLQTWDGLIDLLDKHWPESIFPKFENDDEKRDVGPRLISLLRWNAALREELAAVRAKLGALVAAADGVSDEFPAVSSTPRCHHAMQKMRDVLRAAKEPT